MYITLKPAVCLSLYCETMTFTMWENELLENTNTSQGKQEIASGGKFLKMFPKRFHTQDCINKGLISESSYSYTVLNGIWLSWGKSNGRSMVIVSLVNCFLSDTSGSLEPTVKYNFNNQGTVCLAKRGQFRA